MVRRQYWITKTELFLFLLQLAAKWANWWSASVVTINGSTYSNWLAQQECICLYSYSRISACWLHIFAGIGKLICKPFELCYYRWNHTSYGYGGRGGGRSYGSGFGGPRDFAPKPVEVGKEYDVEITEISRRGDGIAKIQGFIIFVVGAKAGQKVKIKVTNVGPRFANAQIVSPQSEGTESSSTE